MTPFHVTLLPKEDVPNLQWEGAPTHGGSWDCEAQLLVESAEVRLLPAESPIAAWGLEVKTLVLDGEQ